MQTEQWAYGIWSVHFSRQHYSHYAVYLHGGIEWMYEQMNNNSYTMNAIYM